MTDAQTSTILAFDFGMKRIGVAVGQRITHTATPLPTLSANDGIPNWGSIANLLDQWGASAFVVGIPYNMDGTEQNITFCSRKFSNRLRQKFLLPVHTVDERLTTKEAKSTFYAESKKTKIQIDSYAAKLILESWFRSASKE